MTTQKTAEEIAEEREKLRKKYTRSKRRWFKLRIAYFGAIGGTALLCFVGGEVSEWVMPVVWVMLVPTIILGIIGHYFLSPHCPACNTRFQVPVQRFCPACGNDDLKHPSRKEAFLGKKIFCRSCHLSLVQDSENRNFKYRHCTHCGLFLDRKGV